MSIEPETKPSTICARARRRELSAGLAFALALCAHCSGCSKGLSDGLQKYPVRGSVRINGEPGRKVIVTFNNLDRNAPGNTARPVGACDDEGNFQLSTNGENDGAVEGEYAVTFFWPSDAGMMPTDLLEAQFSKTENSNYQIKVKPGENNLEPFKLNFKAKAKKPAKPSQKATPFR